MTDAANTLSHRWFEEVWNQANENVIDELIHPDAVIHGLEGADTSRGPEAFRRFYRLFRQDFSDIHIQDEQIISDGVHEATLCTATARNNATGLQVRFSGMTMVHLKDGKIYEGWNHYDFLNDYQQQGHQLTPDSVGVVAAQA